VACVGDDLNAAVLGVEPYQCDEPYQGVSIRAGQTGFSNEPRDSHTSQNHPDPSRSRTE
jgi:hypothetical protein